jgi:hypothetical protein
MRRRLRFIMKRMLLTLLTIVGLSAVVLANRPEIVSLRAGQQKRAGKGEIIVKFISVEEDSRCPQGTQCVWAGNAKVKVQLSFPKGISKTVVMNTDLGPKGDQLGGWAINLTSLTPLPTKSAKMGAPRYTATFSITRLSR